MGGPFPERHAPILVPSLLSKWTSWAVTSGREPALGSRVHRADRCSALDLRLERVELERFLHEPIGADDAPDAFRIDRRGEDQDDDALLLGAAGRDDRRLEVESGHLRV